MLWASTVGVAILSYLINKLIVAEFGILPDRRCFATVPFSSSKAWQAQESDLLFHQCFETQ
jgi:hypothetical protein